MKENHLKIKEFYLKIKKNHYKIKENDFVKQKLKKYILS